MKIYLVGGAVRDKYLGFPVRERDWVVVGARPEEMLAQNFRPVGKDFPVFLHPVTQEEYALARTERKTAPGYKGFAFNTSTTISIEEDLQRRDLTINAMAEDENGRLIDPYGGLKDLEQRILRHVSDAFGEDPVRILRLARFAARYAGLGFKIAEETTRLIQLMVKSGEIDALVPERVWKEWEKALQEISPARFFEVLHNCGALSILVPEIKTLKEHQLALTNACRLSETPEVRFAAWAFPLGYNGAAALCKRLNLPKHYSELILLLLKQHAEFHKCLELPPPVVLDLLKTLDAFRKPERFNSFLLAAEAISRSSPGREDWPFPQREYLYSAYISAAAITAKKLTKIRLKDKALADELNMHRRAAISKVKRPYRWAKLK